jgi:hypothetical protein
MKIEVYLNDIQKYISNFAEKKTLFSNFADYLIKVA